MKASTSYWGPKLSSFYKLFRKGVVNFCLFLIIWLLCIKLFAIGGPTEVIYYKEYINGIAEKGVEAGARNLSEIEKIEQAILQEINRVGWKDQVDGQQTNTLEKEVLEAKERLRQAEKEFQVRKDVYAKKLPDFENIKKSSNQLSVTESSKSEECGKAWALEKIAERHYEKELASVRKKVIENIHDKLQKAKITITELDIAYYADTKNWIKCSFISSLFRDPQRFFFIRPLQIISKTAGVNLLPFWDMFLKVALIRLFVNWVSYAPATNLPEISTNQEIPTDIYSLQEEKEMAKEQLKRLKEQLFNFAVFCLFFMSLFLHPYLFDKDNSLYSKDPNWMVFCFYLFTSLFSNYLNVRYYQELSFKEYFYAHQISAFLLPSVTILTVYLTYNNKFGYYLSFILSEITNIIFYSIKIVISECKSRSASVSNKRTGKSHAN